MSRTYSTTVDLLQQRVRQSGNVGITQDLACQVFGMCERLANTYLRRVTATSTFSTSAVTLIYDYRATLTTAIDILEITESNRPLLKCDTLHELNALDPDWFRKIDGTRFEAFCQLGRDFLIIYPAKAAGGTNDLSITYTKLVTAYADHSALTTETLTLPDEDADLAVALAELVLLSRFRSHNDIKIRIASLAKQFGIVTRE